MDYINQVVARMEDGTVLVKKQHHSLENHLELKKYPGATFISTYQGVTIPQTDLSTGKVTRIPVLQYWYEMSNGARIYANKILRPQPFGVKNPLIDGELINTWQGFICSNWTPKPSLYKGNVDEFFNKLIIDSTFEYLKRIVFHIQFCWCNGDRQDTIRVLKYMAHIIRFPHIRTEKQIVITGPEGAGKTKIWNAFRKFLLGRHHDSQAQLEHVSGRFNGHQEECILMIIEEAVANHKSAHQTTMADATTNETRAIDRKNEALETKKNYINFVYLSNDDNPIGHSNPSARRQITLKAVKQKDDPVEHRAYQKQLSEALKTESGQHQWFDLLMSFTDQELDDWREDERDTADNTILGLHSRLKGALYKKPATYWLFQTVVFRKDLLYYRKERTSISFSSPNTITDDERERIRKEWTNNNQTTILFDWLFDSYQEWQKKEKAKSVITNLDFYISLAEVLGVKSEDRDGVVYLTIPSYQNCLFLLGRHFNCTPNLFDEYASQQAARVNVSIAEAKRKKDKNIPLAPLFEKKRNSDSEDSDNSSKRARTDSQTSESRLLSSDQ